MKRRTAILTIVALIALALAGWAVSQPQAEPEINAELVGLRTDDSIEGFTRAVEPRAFEFPTDHGPHPEYQTEWWYYTGNLDTEADRRFGYQLTFFRRALTPKGADHTSDRTSDWAMNQVYMAHFTITDVANDAFHNFERFSRGAAGLAGASGTPSYRVWLESWSVEEIEDDTVRLRAAEDGIELDLTLRQVKPPVLHGDAGLSQKSSSLGNASYYYSLTRLDTSGSVTVAGQTYRVNGLSWMDHEFGTSYLADNHTGWDWFSLQLSNERELMYFQIRQDDGGIEPLSGGSLIEADGTVRHLDLEDVTLEVLDTWTSPKTGATYPAGWRLSVPSTDVELNVQPFVNNQELDVSYAYWEGAVKVAGTFPDGPITGVGYVELTGYTGSMRGEF